MTKFLESTKGMPRRQLLRQWIVRAGALAGAAALAGCDKLGANPAFRDLLKTGETINLKIHQAIAPRSAMAQEFTTADLSPTFRGNGNTNPIDAPYVDFVKNAFTTWTLTIDGLVELPTQYSLAQLRGLPARTQITRHDCVEGWSAIGQWTGVPLLTLLEKAKPRPDAKYVVFHCADSFAGRGNSPRVPYYESIDMEDANHAQTILAYALNGKSLPVANGAPLRLRVERQLGYKQAKYITRIELVASLEKLGNGGGGYWEDRSGYPWYAGI